MNSEPFHSVKILALALTLMVGLLAGCTSDRSPLGGSNSRSSGAAEAIADISMNSNNLCIAYVDGGIRCPSIESKDLPSFSAAIDDAYVESYQGNIVGYSWHGDEYCALMENGVAQCDGGIDLEGVSEVDVGFEHSCALLLEGNVQCWGENRYGQLGDGSTSRQRLPVDVQGLTDVVSVAVGLEHSCAAVQDGTVYCWGVSREFPLPGEPVTTKVTAPVPLDGLTDVTDVAASSTETCVTHRDGTASCWGFSGSGSEAGAETYSQVSGREPVRVPGLSGISELVMDAGSSCALLQDATVHCWHMYYTPESPRYEPTQIEGISDAVKVEVSTVIGCALLRDNSVTCWFSGPVPAVQGNFPPYDPRPVEFSSAE